MINLENLVYTTVREAVKAYNPNVTVSGLYNDTPSTIPHVAIEETNNAVVTNTISTSDREYAAELTYTVNVFTNTATAKSDANALAEVVNDAFAAMGFARSMKQRMPNIDRTIYRVTMRFNATAWKAFDGADGHYNITSR